MNRKLIAHAGRVVAPLALLVAAARCSPARAPQAASDLASLRQAAERNADSDTLAGWYLAEMIAPGGTPRGARRARVALDGARASGPLAWLSRGFDEAWHGRSELAASHFFEALGAASTGSGAQNRLIAWLAAVRFTSLADFAVSTQPHVRERIEALMRAPGGIGWRARAHLAQWWLDQHPGPPPPGAAVEQLGCVVHLRFAGPFGSAEPVHLGRSFPPEAPGPWPTHWKPHSPRAALHEARLSGCAARAESAPPGVYYVETFFELEREEELLVAVQGAIATWVDDRQVLERDPAVWGVWPRFGVSLRLGPGRHRLMSRLSEPHTLVRFMRLDGRPLTLPATHQDAAPYRLEAPQRLVDPNDVMRFVSPEGPPRELDLPTRFLVANLAALEGEADVASVVLDPLARPPEAATGPTLQMLARFAREDPMVPRTELADRVREWSELAVRRDPNLWRSQLSLAVGTAQRDGLHVGVERLKTLSRQFPGVAEVWNAWANALGRLGWQPEYRSVVREMAQRFPGEASALQAYLNVADQTGASFTASGFSTDEWIDRLSVIDPSSQTRLQRALRARDRATAQKELARLSALEPLPNPELEKLQLRLRLQSGDEQAYALLAETELSRNPHGASARLATADLALAGGDAGALREALTAAAQAGAATQALQRAIDVVEARTDFEPFRLDGRQVIAEYEASGEHQSATAARVLDYAAVWVRSDGSSRMLEHEIVRLQSAEAISKFAEHRKLPGVVLQMRVIKQDGTTLEPEWVDGKPSVTFPHLEVGDYVETEQVQGFEGQADGERYAGLRWFFREENVAYARSEFVLVAPEHRPLDIELTGNVPEAEVSHDGLFVTRRWRVDRSPAAPVEPLSAPIQEFLPSVRIAWGLGLEQRLRRLAERVHDVTPLDPRVVELAHRIVPPRSGESRLGLARRAYRWVQDNVKDGDESDPRRALAGRQGNRWLALRALLRGLGVPVQYLVARNRLAAPPRGPMSEAEAFGVPLLRIGARTASDAPAAAGEPTAWLTLRERHAPFGYVPVEARGMPAFELRRGKPQALRVPDAGDQDRLEYTGRVTLRKDGSARLSLEQRFVGKYAVRMRTGLEQVPEGRLAEVIETRVLGRALPGARLLEHELVGRDDLESPLILHMDVAVGGFAQLRSDGFVIELPLMPKLSMLAALPARQTPLLIGEALHQRVRLELVVAPDVRVMGLQQGRVEHGPHRVIARDRREPSALVLDREVNVAAGRVAPESYEEFAAFTRTAERMLTQPIVLRSEPTPRGPR